MTCRPPQSFINAVDQLIKCYKETFPESVLFIAPDPIPIYWSDFSLLQADLECMEYLLAQHSTWKYFINQAGTAMPAVSTDCYKKCCPKNMLETVAKNLTQA